MGEYNLSKGVKKCPYCKMVKPIEDFNYHHSKGVQGYCKECQIEYQVRYKHKKKLLEEYMELQKRVEEIEIELGIAE